MVKETPRDDFTTDELPGYDDTQYERRPRRVWNGFAGWTPDKPYPDGMSRPDGSKQGDRDE